MGSNRRCLVLIITFSLAGVLGCTDDPPVPVLDLEEFAEPGTDYRPWARWWWPGNDVESTELRREVDLLADAYFGGAEIQAFDAALNPEAEATELERRLSFDSPAYYENLAVVMDQARKHGLTIDLTFGSGWPAAGVNIDPQESLKTLLYNEWFFKGPGQANIELLEPQKGTFYEVAEMAGNVFGEDLARYMGDQAELVELLAAKVIINQRTSSLFDLKDTVKIDSDSLQVITSQVAAEGTLSWNVPDGDWVIIGIFSLPDGEYPILPASQAEAFVIDHFDSAIVTNHLDYLFGQRTGLDTFYGDPLRAIFSDSFEFKTERHFSRKFLTEFKSRRGYDLIPWLPAVLLPGADNYIYEVGRLDRATPFTFSKEDHRILYDYSLTVSDLFISEYLEATSSWAEQRGMQSRAQAYGINLDNIRAAGSVSLPEAEQLYAGGADMFLHMVSAGAHLYNRKLVSAEAMVWPGRDYMTTIMKMKAGADKAFSAGINHLIYHGFPYAHPGDFGMTGWTPFSSCYGGTNTFASNVGERFAFWDYLPQLNRYVARCHYLLRQGQPESDILVYYPWLGFPSSLALDENHFESLLGGFIDGEPELREVPFAELAALFGEPVTDSRVAWLTSIWPQLVELQQAGYTWEWVNDHSLAEAKARGAKIDIRGNVYKALLLFETRSLQVASAQILAKLAKSGVPIMAVGETADQQPGFHNYKDADNLVRQAMQQVTGSDNYLYQESPADLAAGLGTIGVAPTLAFSGTANNLYQIQRRLSNGGLVVFVRNSEIVEQSTSIKFDKDCSDPRWLDAWTGAAYSVEVSDDNTIALDLSGYESVFLVCGEGPIEPGSLSPNPKTLRPGPGAEEIELDSWQLTVTGDDVVSGSLTLSSFSLQDWREIEELKYVGSSGKYVADFEVGQIDPEQAVELDLGRVQGVVIVSVNGGQAVPLLVSPFRLDISGQLESGSNTISIELIPPWRNRLVGLAIDGDERYTQFTGKENTLIAIGLLGPVKLRIEKRESRSFGNNSHSTF